METLNTVPSYIIYTIQLFIVVNINMQFNFSQYSFKKTIIGAAIISSYFILLVAFELPYLAIIVLFVLIVFPVYFFVFRLNVMDSIFCTAIQYLVSAPGELLLQILLMLFFDGVEETHIMIPMQIAATLILLGIYLLFRYNRSVNKYIQFTQRLKNIYLGFLIFSFSIVYLNVGLLSVENPNYYMMCLFNGIIIVTFVICNTIIAFKFSEQALKSQQLEMQQLYTSTLESTIDNLRGFKHDFSDIIQSIDSLVWTNNIDALKDYMAKLNRDVLKVTTSELLSAFFKDMPVIYGLLLSKQSLAEVNHVEFHISLMTQSPTKSLVNPVDMSRIIGNLLNNAIEEARNSPNGFVSMTIDRHYGHNKFMIINSCEKEVDIEKIFGPGYTSKPDHSGNGLNIINKIIHDYERQDILIELETDYYNKTLIQILLI